MSHDQRPGKIRVVQDAARANVAGRGNASAGGAADGSANGANGSGGSAANGAGGAGSAGSKSLPTLQAAIFLVACIIGGVAFAFVRPF